MRVLFVTWDGPQVSYLESLFLPIFDSLRPHGIHFDVLQFRWGDPEQLARAKRWCEALGVGYRGVGVWRRPGGIGPLLSAVAGGLHVRRAAAAFRCDVIMPRSLMPGVAVLAAGGARLRPLAFDSDGLAADERVEFAGLSAEGLTYRIWRDVEAQLVRTSASVLVRSAAAAETLWHRAGPPVPLDRFHVVANGRDESLFCPHAADQRLSVRHDLEIDPDAPLAVYAGSVGAQYRFEDVRAFAAELRRLRPDARLLVLSGSPELAAKELQCLPATFAKIIKAEPAEVPRYLAAADVGLAFRSTAYSMRGVAPIKLAEYLLCGLPVVGTVGIGDTSQALAAGVLFDAAAGPAAAAEWVADTIMTRREEYRQKARAVGLQQFSLRQSAADYLSALSVLKAAV